MRKRNKNKKRRIPLKIKKARKIFGTTVSRGYNKEQSGHELTNPQKESKKQDESGDINRNHFSPLANFALCKQLDGSLDFEEGTTGWWSMRATKGYGSILKSDYDFSSEDVSQDDKYIQFLKTPIPKAVLKNASNFRIGWYERLLNSNDIVRSLPYTLGATICFEIFNGIYNAPNGLVPMPKFWEKSHGGHSVFIIGYNNKKRLLKFLNSWGEEWGDNGRGYLSYDYVDKYLIEAWTMFNNQEDEKYNKIENIGEFEYKFQSYEAALIGKQPLHVVDVYKQKRIVGWVHFCFDDLGHSIIIEDIFIMPDWRSKGIARQLLDLVESVATKYLIPKIISYIHVQDLLSSHNISAIENLFSQERGYKIIPFNKQFKGCVYKIVKDDIF